MIRICLDTSAYSHFKRGHAPVTPLVTSAREVSLPVIVLGELRSGFRLGVHAQRNETELREFMTSPVVRLLEVDDDTSSIYADMVTNLRRAGTPLPTNDIWIAALAVRVGSTLITYDHHFTSIRRLGAVILEP